MIPFPKDVFTIKIFGDWHGDYKRARKALYRLRNENVDAVLHVGDLGIWKDTSTFIKVINDICEELGIIFMFVDGNHEDHELLNAIPIDPDGVRRLAPHVWHLPRGFRWEWAGVTFMALGGAPSINKQDLTRGFDWFPEEVITMGEAYRATEGGHVDVMITHDCPAGIAIPGIDEYGGGWPLDALATARSHRELLRQVAEKVTPNAIFHGHYHIYYEETLILDTGHAVKVIGLDMNKGPLNKNGITVTVVDLLNYQYENRGA